MAQEPSSTSCGPPSAPHFHPASKSCSRRHPLHLLPVVSHHPSPSVVFVPPTPRAVAREAGACCCGCGWSFSLQLWVCVACFVPPPVVDGNFHSKRCGKTISYFIKRRRKERKLTWGPKRRLRRVGPWVLWHVCRHGLCCRVGFEGCGGGQIEW
jgi:hypothetical protein